jgi:hypothetical protein
MRKLLGLLGAWPLLAGAQSVSLTIAPEAVYVESSAHEQFLNFDLQVENRLDVALDLVSVELSVLDAEGTVVRRDFVDRQSRRSVELEPTRTLAAKGRLNVFNPFHTFAADVPLERLRYRLAFVGPDKKLHTVEAEVRPLRYRTKTALIPPLRGHLLVWDGHDHASHHRRTEFWQRPMGPEFPKYRTNFQRYSFDFVVVDDQGEISREPRATTEDWYAHKVESNERSYSFGVDVLAAGAGRIVEMHDGEADDLHFDPAALATRETAYGGNYVIIDHGNGEFSWFGHLKQGSVRVKVGQAVRQGEVIAAVGASGSSLFPHLHYELRSAPGAVAAEGLPAAFTGFRQHGKWVRKPTRLDTGDIIDVR